MAQINVLGPLNFLSHQTLLFSLSVNVLYGHGEATVLCDVFALHCLVTFNPNIVDLQNVGLFSGSASQHKPVVESVKALSMGNLGNHSDLNPSLTIAGECHHEFLEICTFSSIFFRLRLFED